MPSRRNILGHLPEAVEVEQIRSLFQAFGPSAVFSGVFLVGGLVACSASRDALMLGLTALGFTLSIARLATARILAGHAVSEQLTLRTARRIERRFAIAYLGFAACLGLFGARAFALPLPEVHMLVICMLVGYCSGVAVGMGLRLWIAAPAMLLATVPMLLVALLKGDILYTTMAGSVIALLVGGIGHLRVRHERSVENIGLRLAFATLARKDALTALPNRIALREWFEEHTGRGRKSGLLAVHYIDLNGFKPVNDSYGHPVGDMLLALVGKRIAHSIREGDIAARLGGDEFAVIQHGIASADEAELCANRLAEAIGQPYRIGDHLITISTGLGYVVADGRDEDLDHLLGLADKALYISKRKNGLVTQYDAVEPIQIRAA